MKTWRMLAALCMIGALVFSFAACGAAPTEPTTEPTDATMDAATDATGETEPLVDPETFKDFITTWYADGSSASYKIIIKKDATWTFNDPNGEAMASGIVVVIEDNEAISLCDADGVQVFDIKLEEAGKLYVETYGDGLSDLLTSSYFLNKVTNSEGAYVPFTEEEHVMETPEEDTTPATESDLGEMEEVS